MERDLEALPPSERDLERRVRLNAWLDAGHGSCVLQDPAVAQAVQDNLLFFDAERYRLFAWTIMPNHVHALIQSINGWPIPKIVATWKKFSAARVREVYPSEDGRPVWHREYWDRFIRNVRHFWKVVDYIQENPVKAGLVATADEWRWGSAGSVVPGANQAIGVPRRMAGERDGGSDDER